jgi:hypothetical protein
VPGREPAREVARPVDHGGEQREDDDHEPTVPDYGPDTERLSARRLELV